MKRFARGMVVFCLLLTGGFRHVGVANATIVVTFLSTGPAGVETSFIANATNYAVSSLSFTPPDAWKIKVSYLNPNYASDGPKNVVIDTTTWFSNIAAMQALLPAISSDSYVNGYANGMRAQIYNEIGVNNGYWNLCGSTNTWLAPGSTSTYVTLDSTKTCSAVLGNIAYSVYQLLYGTSSPAGY